MPPTSLPRALGDGLVLRWATPADTGALAQFNGRIHGDPDEPNPFVVGATRDWMADLHPTIGARNFTLVEDTRNDNRVVSSLCLIPQTWTYGGIPFGVGRPEIVGTDPAYRRRGLVRAQMDAAHARSAELGHLVQGITGILWYYRQFGYEYALALGGGRHAPLSTLPKLKADESEAYRLRPMTADDIPFLMPLYERACARSLVACPRDAAYWRYLLTGPTPGAYEHRPNQTIESAAGRPVGYVMPQLEFFGAWFVIGELEVSAGEPLRAVLPTVLRGLQTLAEAEARRQVKNLSALYFALGGEHPAFAAAPDLFPITRPPYAWYLRVPDLSAFLLRIAPVLAARLAASPFAGYTGDLLLSEFVRGWRLQFAQGQLTAVEPWQPPDDSDDARANFPPLVFLHLLFGHHAWAELRAIYPDCATRDETRALLDALFPRQFSNVTPVGS
jgi:hypothetical protein